MATEYETTGEQWDKPNGWAPLQWMAIEGLQTVWRRICWAMKSPITVKNGEPFYQEHHKLIEKYHISGGTRPRKYARRGGIRYRTGSAGPMAWCAA